jgi:hypothetical protein
MGLQKAFIAANIVGEPSSHQTAAAFELLYRLYRQVCSDASSSNVLLDNMLRIRAQPRDNCSTSPASERSI